MRELALHILDIAENSVAALARDIKILIKEDTVIDCLRITIEDNGIGMEEKQVAQVTDPFFTSRTTRKVGLGIPFLKAAAEACNGYLEIQSTRGLGTRLLAEFKRSHIDRMPLGNLPDTMLHLLIGNPEIHWIFQYQVDEQVFLFDDLLIKKELEGIPLSEPAILTYLRQTIEEGVKAIQPHEVPIRLG